MRVKRTRPARWAAAAAVEAEAVEAEVQVQVADWLRARRAQLNDAVNRCITDMFKLKTESTAETS